MNLRNDHKAICVAIAGHYLREHNQEEGDDFFARVCDQRSQVCNLIPESKQATVESCQIWTSPPKKFFFKLRQSTAKIMAIDV